MVRTVTAPTVGRAETGSTDIRIDLTCVLLTCVLKCSADVSAPFSVELLSSATTEKQQNILGLTPAGPGGT